MRHAVFLCVACPPALRNHLYPALHYLPLCGTVSLLAFGSPFLHLSPFPPHVTAPPHSLSGAQKRLSLRYSILCPVPHFLMVLRHDPTATGNGHLQQSVLSLFPSYPRIICPPAATPPTHTHTPFKRTHLEQVTDHFKRFECGEVITLPRWSPPAPLLLLTARLRADLSSIITILHTAGVIGLLVMSVRDSHLYSWSHATVILSAKESSLCLLVHACAISTSRCHCVSCLSQQRKREDGGRVGGERVT